MSECFVCSKNITDGNLCSEHCEELYEILLTGENIEFSPNFKKHCSICGENDDRNIIEYKKYTYFCDRDIVEDFFRYFEVKEEKIFFVEPWYRIEGNSDYFENEAYKEISERHDLYNKKLKGVARRGDRDDVLYKILDNSERYIVIHLTYNGIDKNGKFPKTHFYENINDWVKLRMIQDFKSF